MLTKLRLRQENMIALDNQPALGSHPAVNRMTPQFSVLLPRRFRQALSAGGLALLLGSLPGCQSITGSPLVSQVRIIDASPDAPGIDVYQGTGVLAYNLGLGTITSYVPTTPGTFQINVDVAGTRQQVVSTYGTFVTGGQYTVIVGNYLASLQEIVLKDQTQPAPAGQVALRFVDQSTRGGAVDLYLIPSGSTITQVRPVLTNINFGTNTGYVNVPAGTYTLAAMPAGTIPTSTATTSYTGSASVYSYGTAKTIVLIDQQLITTPGIQAVIADDYDPVGAPN